MLSANKFPIFYISLAAFLWPLFNQYHEIYFSDLLYAIVIFNIVIFIEVIILWVIVKTTDIFLVKKPSNFLIKKIECFFVSVIVTANIYYFLLILINIKLETKLLVAFLCVPFIYFLVINKNRLKFSFIFTKLFIALSLLNFLYSFSLDNSLHKKTTEWKLEKYQSLNSLKDKVNRRNIYMISFDSAVSPESLRALYNNPTAVHLEFLKDAGFKVLDSAFSAGQNTSESFYNLLSLGEEDTRFIKAFYATRNLNPTYTLLENIGYKVQFLFVNNYLGANTNTLDYFYPEGKFITLCDYIDKSYGFFACSQKFLRPLNYIIFGTKIGFETFYNKLLERLEIINKDKNESWVTISHIYSPGHTSGGFVYTDSEEKEKYIAKMLSKYNEVESMLRELVNLIHEVDNDPVILIYADHGALITRGLRYGEKNELYNADEIYLDKRGIMFAVYPYYFCSSKFHEGYNTVNIIGDMLECENSQ